MKDESLKNIDPYTQLLRDCRQETSVYVGLPIAPIFR